MANLNETSTFEAVIHEIGTDEPVLGGPGGNSNVQAQQLANRTKWLKDAIDNLESGGGPFDYNASSGNLPNFGTDGAGVAGIKRKDYYFVTVPGVVSSVSLQIGDALIAKVDDADVIGEFIIQQANSDLATPTVVGMVKLVQNLSGGAQADAALSVAGLINLFAQLNGPAFTGNPTTPDQTAGNNSTRIANTKYVDAAVGVEAGARATAVTNEANARIAGDNAEATARSNADTALQGNINTEATNRNNADVALQGNIDAANNARANADSTLQGNINTEAATRAAADTNLQNQINALNPNGVAWEGAGTGWTYPGNAGNYNLSGKIVNGSVYLSGAINVNSGTSGQTVLTLPPAYRPIGKSILFRPVAEGIIGNSHYAWIHPSGAIEVWEYGKSLGAAFTNTSMYLHLDYEFAINR